MINDKSVHHLDVCKEICKTDSYIKTLEEELRILYIKVDYLKAISDYLKQDSISPFISKDIITNDRKLQEFAMPLLVKDTIYKKQKNIPIDYSIEPNVIYKLLENFIDFVCLYKGHKVCIGKFLIEKFIEENVVLNKYDKSLFEN